MTRGSPLGERHAGAGKTTRSMTGITAAGGCCLALLAGFVAFEGSESDGAWLLGLARGLIVATPIAVGIYARRHAASRRFGGLLLATGALAFFATLAESDASVLYSVGRVSGWLLEVWFIFLVLSFPTGRLPSRADRVLVLLAGIVTAVLYLPTLPLVDAFPLPSVWTSCTGSECPGNAFMVVGDEPAWVVDVVVPVRETLTFLVFLGVTMRLAGRLRGASRLVRLTLSPVLTVAVVRCAVLCAALIARRIAPDSAAVGVAVWTLALGLPAMAVAFVVGLARWRRFDAAAMRRLAARLRDRGAAEDLRSALADAFGDRSLELVYRLESGGGWRDAAGAAVEPPDPGPNRCVTLIRDRDRVVAAMTHDAALRDDGAFIDSATSYVLMTLDNERLAAQASRLVGKIDESRARIQRAADEERRRLEQDLHDGAQQRLVALRIQLELAAERFDGANGDAAGEAENLRELGAEVERALDEVRSLARGIYPSVLTDRGLVDALRSAALRAPMAVTVLAPGVVGRYPAEVESAAYFCCLEALQNAAKHAGGATAVVVELSEEGVLCFEVRDDGPGFEVGHATGGMGMASMRDRLDAVGGALVVVSSPGRGTRVIGRIPVRTRHDAPVARPGDTGPAAAAERFTRRERPRRAGRAADEESPV